MYERQERLKEEVARHEQKGWQVEGETEFTTTVIKEWTWQYMFLPTWRGEGTFRRRLITVYEDGTVEVKKLRARGAKASRYGNPDDPRARNDTPANR